MKFYINNNFKSFIYILIFCLGILFVINNYNVFSREGFKSNKQCPDILIQKGDAVFLYNSKLANIPGRNPIRFNNLDEYIQFLQWERSQGIICPILYLQHGIDPQGNSVFSRQNLPFEMDTNTNPIQKFGKNSDNSFLLNSTRNNPPYNKNQFPGFDPENQYVGLNTPIDELEGSKDSISDNPMDPNWGGPKFTQKLVDSGYYKDDEVKIMVK